MFVVYISMVEEGVVMKIECVYSGLVKNGGKFVDVMWVCDLDVLVVVMVFKFILKSDCSAFDAFGRVMCGMFRKNDCVCVFGENFFLDDEEDSVVKNVMNMWIYEVCYCIFIKEARAGVWVFIEGID